MSDFQVEQNFLRILIVEDGAEDRMTYMRHLEKRFDGNCSFIECETGREGIQAIKNEKPDCILLDYLLPDMDGIEFLSLVNVKGYAGAIIMLTGQGSESVAVEAMKNGANDYLIKNNFSPEALSSAVLKAVNNNQCDETKKWKTRALVDPLTNILNRNAYNLTMEQTIRDFKRYKSPTSIMVADIDNFKRLNDRYGHLTGDNVLRSVAESINNTLRASDFVFRYGGEEFVILLKKITLDQARNVAEKIRHQVESSYCLDNETKIYATISMGVTKLLNSDTEVSVFKRADQALYQAKSRGRNRVEIAEELTDDAS